MDRSLLQSHRKQGLSFSPLRFFLHLPSPKFPELLDCTGTEASEMIIGERQNLNLPLVNRFQNFDPLGQLRAAVNDHFVPDLRLRLDPLAIPKPPYIREVGSDGAELLEPLRRPGHPRLVDQGKGNPAFAQCLYELGNEPILVSDFDRELVALWELFEEWSEPCQKVIHADECFLVEVSELEQQRSKLVAENIHHFDELLELRVTIYQHPFVRNDLRIRNRAI